MFVSLKWKEIMKQILAHPDRCRRDGQEEKEKEKGPAIRFIIGTQPRKTSAGGREHTTVKNKQGGRLGWWGAPVTESSKDKNVEKLPEAGGLNMEAM